MTPSHELFRQLGKLIEPPPGGFFFGSFSNEEPVAREPPLKNEPKNCEQIPQGPRGGPFSQGFEGRRLPPGSSFGDHPERKTPQGGGFLSINLCCSCGNCNRSYGTHMKESWDTYEWNTHLYTCDVTHTLPATSDL